MPIGPFDPNNPPGWVTRMLERAATAEGESFHVELREAKGGSAAIALGAGTYAAPLPVGWVLHPGRPYEGRLRVKEGYDVFYRIDSYEDGEAAAGGARLIAYANEPEFAGSVNTPSDILNDFLISIPGRDPAGKDILWKCIEPMGGTHVRELVLRCPLVAAELIEHREEIARSIGEWMGLGRFAPEPTPLDLVAHTAALERVNFQDTVLMRVPRGWKVEVDSEEDGRKLFAVDEPEDRETIWVTSQIFEAGADADPAMLEAALAEIADASWKQMDGDPRWLTLHREELDHGDHLIMRRSEEVERGDTLRRLTWIRYGVRDGVIICVPIHLVAVGGFRDDPEQRRQAQDFDREVRNAILLAPPVEGG